MTADVISFDDLTRDRKAFRLRLAGMSTLRIADELRCSLDQVEQALTRMCAGVTPELTC